MEVEIQLKFLLRRQTSSTSIGGTNLQPKRRTGQTAAPKIENGH
jgi:hypothetical protein